MVRLTEEEKKNLVYQIYSQRYDDPWVTDSEIAAVLGYSNATVHRYVNKALKEEVMKGPEIRLRPVPKRRTAFLLFEDKYKAFEELKKLPNVIYVSIYQGHWNIIVSYDDFIEFTQISGYKNTVIKGLRGESLTPKVQRISWEKSFEKMKKLLKDETPEQSTLQFSPLCPKWNEKDWEIYNYLKFDLRSSFNKFRKHSPIGWGKFEEWKKSLEKYCSIHLFYYPKGRNSYRNFTLCLQTRYEKFMVNLLSCLPTTPGIYKIGYFLCANILVPKSYYLQLKFLKLISFLLDEGILMTYSDRYVIMHYNLPDKSCVCTM